MAKKIAANMSAKSPKGDFSDISSLVEMFCREHLNEEYTNLCKQLFAKLARKRPSPFASGKPNTWACGIIRTVGWVNFLDDSSTKPYMKLTAIDKALGVGESTGQGKCMAIRRMLKLQQFAPEWTLPSRLDKNPMAWMLSINGFIVDVRHATRDVQEVAFKKGLIPYLPAENGHISAE